MPSSVTLDVTDVRCQPLARRRISDDTWRWRPPPSPMSLAITDMWRLPSLMSVVITDAMLVPLPSGSASSLAPPPLPPEGPSALDRMAIPVSPPLAPSPPLPHHLRRFLPPCAALSPVGLAHRVSVVVDQVHEPLQRIRLRAMHARIVPSAQRPAESTAAVARRFARPLDNSGMTQGIETMADPTSTCKGGPPSREGTWAASGRPMVCVALSYRVEISSPLQIPGGYLFLMAKMCFAA